MPSSDFNFDVDIQVDLGGAAFIQFNEGSNTLTIQSNTTVEEDLGAHTVLVKLTSKDTESEEVYLISFVILPPESGEIG